MLACLLPLVYWQHPPAFVAHDSPQGGSSLDECSIVFSVLVVEKVPFLNSLHVADGSFPLRICLDGAAFRNCSLFFWRPVSVKPSQYVIYLGNQVIGALDDSV